MKKNVLFISMIALMTACSQQKQASVPAIDPSNFDTSIAPNEDFYQYATGGWQKKNPLKPEFARYGAFDSGTATKNTGRTARRSCSRSSDG